ncbi:transcriptional regulator [Pilimelia terevasa]|uniref:Transcriptional regulator n=1 Tax=Pilimelia terevasa TaxID=53372 RepID=A0A8J3FG85_9ACTN|nr:MurR/RpiR family transcriptional regulator [Pilimelia terevasa]GGK15891.1 transcriptional regulator [Pilimelia terevasa]
MNEDEINVLWRGVRLTPAQRRIAHVLAARPAGSAFLSAAELAEAAGVSQPSVTRFAVALGLDGYPALRRRLRDLAAAPPAAAGDEHPWQAAVRAERANLDRLADALADPGAVAAAAALLAGSSPLLVLGLRTAAPLAAYVGHFGRKVHPDVRVLDHGGSQLADALEQGRAAGAAALLAVVLPRYPREAVDALAVARAAGLRVVLVTDSPVAPAAAHADLTLVAPVGTDLVFDLHAAPLALTMVLLQAVCDAGGTGAQRRLEAFDASADRRGIFVD